MIKYLLLISVITIGTIGQIFLKTGANEIAINANGKSITSDTINIILMLIKNKWIIYALFLYGIGFIIWLLTLFKFELNQVFPITALVYITILFSSWFFLHESLSITKIIGTIVVFIGVTLVMLNK